MLHNLGWEEKTNFLSMTQSQKTLKKQLNIVFLEKRNFNILMPGSSPPCLSRRGLPNLGTGIASFTNTGGTRHVPGTCGRVWPSQPHPELNLLRREMRRGQEQTSKPCKADGAPPTGAPASPHALSCRVSALVH